MLDNITVIKLTKGSEKLARNKNYDPKGKAHLLHAGVNKEKEYILNWMRKEYSQNEPYNMSDGVWIVLAKHIEEVEKTRTKYSLTRKGKRMIAQDKFFALVEKWE